MACLLNAFRVVRYTRLCHLGEKYFPVVFKVLKGEDSTYTSEPALFM